MVEFTNRFCEHLLYKMASEAHLLHLFTNDYRPNRNSTLDSFESPKCKCYAPIEMRAEKWSFDDVAMRFLPSTFRVKSCKVYGYYVTNVYGDLLWAEAFPLPFTPFLGNMMEVCITPALQFE